MGIALTAAILSGCDPYTFGSDGNAPSASQPGTSPGFFVGRLGEGSEGINLTPDPCNKPSNSWMTSGAGGTTAVDHREQFGYWWLTGPNINPTGSPIGTGAAYSLGYAEGVTAYYCWIAGAISGNSALYPGPIVPYTNTDSHAYGGLVLFGDVEEGSDGDPGKWFYHDPTPEMVKENTQTIVGFLDAVSDGTQVAPGIYTSASFLDTIAPGIDLKNGCAIGLAIDPCPARDYHLPASWWDAGVAPACITAAENSGNSNMSGTLEYPSRAPGTVIQDYRSIETNVQVVTKESNGVLVGSAGPCALANLSAVAWQYVISCTYGPNDPTCPAAGQPDDYDIADLINQHLTPGKGICRSDPLVEGVYQTVCGGFFTPRPIFIGTLPP